MICDDLTPPVPDDRRVLAIAVITAACTTVVTALATWAVEELRAKYGSKKPADVQPAKEEAR
jgi:hypothetical protein